MAKIEYEKKGPIAYITLNRPEAMNAIDFEMIDTMDKAWSDFRADDGLRVAILRSSGKHFCAGFDIMSMAEKLGKEQFVWNKSSMFGDRNINPVEHGVQKPIIAALNGNVNGAGLWLALSSDIRIATQETSFGLGEVRINFPVEFSALLPRYMPVGLAAEMLFTACRVNSKRFYELGVINALVEQDALLSEAESYARDICAGAPLAVRAMKELVYQGYDLGYQEIMELSARIVAPVVNSQDTMEGIQAFAQKRRPEWKGK